MAVKSIIQVDVDDAQFKKFQDAFKKHQEQLNKLPGGWDKVNKALGTSWKSLLGAGVAAGVVVEEVEKAKTTQEKFGEAVKTTTRHMGTLARSTKDVASNIARATKDLIKWSEVVGAVSGLVGVGGLYGIDRLAQSVSSQQRFSQGVGASYGGSSAFSLNYSRYVDPDSFLSNLNSVIHDPNKQGGIGGQAAALAGQGLSTSDIAVRLLPSILQQYRAGGKTAQGAHAYGLDNLLSIEDLNRLDQNGGSLGTSAAAYGSDSSRLGVGSDVQAGWRDLGIQLDRAGREIETTFVKGLVKLNPYIEKLSQDFADAAETFVSDGGFKELITALGDGLKWLGKELGSDAFRSGIHNFAAVVGTFASAGEQAAGDIANGYTADSRARDEKNLQAVYNHNPGNMRVVGSPTKFQSFGSDAEGVAAIAGLMRSYEKHGLNTLSSIISTYAPPSENDTPTLIKNAVRRSARAGDNWSADQKLGSDPTTIAKLVGLILAQEGRNPAKYSIDVNVYNNTPGNVVVTGSQLAR